MDQKRVIISLLNDKAVRGRDYTMWLQGNELVAQCTLTGVLMKVNLWNEFESIVDIPKEPPKLSIA